MQFIDLKEQYECHKKEIDKAIHRVLDSGKYIMGPEVFELEKQLSEYVGGGHVISVSSGTDSLLIALMALGVGPGSEVITVPFTWISSSEVIKMLGATPVFVDITEDDFNMDVSKIEAAITEKTKAIMPVCLFGQMANCKKINEIASKYNIPVIEDAAQSFGSEQDGKKSCSTTTVGSTSFFPAKPLGCYGDGGALFTKDDALAEKMKAIRTHGGVKRHHHPYVGMNGRLDTIQAAILIEKLKFFDWEISQKQELAKRYDKAFNGLIATPQVGEGMSHVYALYTLRSDNRDEIVAHLKSKEIPSPVYYPKCLHEQPVFQDLGYKYGDFPVSEKMSQTVFSLPMHAYLSFDEQDQVIEAVLERSTVSV